MILKSKPIIIITLSVIILGLAAWLLHSSLFAQPERIEEPKTVKPLAVKNTALDGKSFFPAYRLQRERVRGQQVELLREIINNSNTDDKSRQSALERLLSLTGLMDKELQAEGVLKARGFKEALVIMQDTDATVVVSGRKDIEEYILTRDMADFLGLETNQVNVIFR